MTHKPCRQFQRVFTRRELLRQSGAGFGLLALQGLLGQYAAHSSEGSETSNANPLAARAPHFTPRAKRVIFLFMHGGPSQVDTFDYKPLLARDHGKPLPFDKPRVVSSDTGNLLASPWTFRQYGQSGAWVSELFPHVGQCVDDLCFLHWHARLEFAVTAARCSNCTPAATRSSGRAWDRGSATVWEPRTTICRPLSRSVPR